MKRLLALLLVVFGLAAVAFIGPEAPPGPEPRPEPPPKTAVL